MQKTRPLGANKIGSRSEERETRSLARSRTSRLTPFRKPAETLSDQKKNFQKESARKESFQKPRPLERVMREAIHWADRAKDFERHEVSSRVFAVLLSLFENNPEKIQRSRIEAGVTVRENRRKSGKLSNGYRDLAWITAGSEELCLPIPKLSRKYACWFYAHAERREEKEGQRETRDGKEKEIRVVEREAKRVTQELKSGWKVTNPDHYLAEEG